MTPRFICLTLTEPHLDSCVYLRMIDHFHDTPRDWIFRFKTDETVLWPEFPYDAGSLFPRESRKQKAQSIQKLLKIF